MKTKVVIFGPFIGELMWEMYYFAPHFIYRARRKEGKKFIVITRKESFDLYGKYADVISPLKISKEDEMKKCNFSIEGLAGITFNKIKKNYIEHFEKTYFIDEIVTPEISVWKKDIKWQFPRDETDYNFLPRNDNKRIVNNILLPQQDIIFNNTEDTFLGYKNIRRNHVKEMLRKTQGSNFSFYGIVIEILKNCNFYIGDFDSKIARLAILLNVPVITEKVSIKEPDLHLINPLNSVIIEEKYKEGVEMYENNF